jgi:FkbM family methyltransferase
LLTFFCETFCAENSPRFKSGSVEQAAFALPNYCIGDYRHAVQIYRRNKFLTACEMVRHIENWPTAWALRLFRNQKHALRLLSFRDGLQTALRGGTRDWDVLHEIIFAGGYGKAFEFLGRLTQPASVLDLGGNIGIFSLACARCAPKAHLFSYEPGPPNHRIFEINCLANPDLGARIELYRKAVGGKAREDNWFFDEANPGGSGLFAQSGKPCRVEIAAFADVVANLPKPIALAKIDVEGAEYEILDETPPEIWKQIQAISLELHDDPRGRLSQNQFLERMRSLGFSIQEESVCSFFLQRK